MPTGDETRSKETNTQMEIQQKLNQSERMFAIHAKVQSSFQFSLVTKWHWSDQGH